MVLKCFTYTGINQTMNKEEFIKLSERIADGIANEQEYRLYNRVYAIFQEGQTPWAEASDEEKLQVKAELQERITQHVQPAQPVKLWPRIFNIRLAAMVAAIIVITSGVWLYYISNNGTRHPELISGSQLANDIRPGSNKATITLANGQVIDLSAQKSGVIIGKGGMTYSDGDSLQNGVYTKVQTLTASTPRGGMYDFVLPDGSKVYLNAATTIKFPSSFDKKNRVVELLSGEAYFEVAKDKMHPFIVKSKGQQVEVLGTHFNIRSYADDEESKTTLLEGSVEISTAASKMLLKPNQQATLAKGRLEVDEVEPEIAVAWKNGSIQFENEDIRSIMKKIERWYDVEVAYDGTPGTVGIGGAVPMSMSLKQVLKILESTDQFKFKLEGRRVTVMP